MSYYFPDPVNVGSSMYVVQYKLASDGLVCTPMVFSTPNDAMRAAHGLDLCVGVFRDIRVYSVRMSSGKRTLLPRFVPRPR